MIRLRQRGDLPHRCDAARVATVGPQNVQATILQIGNELPDGAIAFAGGQRNCNLFLQPLEHLDVARHGRFLDEKYIVGLEARASWISVAGGTAQWASNMTAPLWPTFFRAAAMDAT